MLVDKFYVKKLHIDMSYTQNRLTPFLSATFCKEIKNVFLCKRLILAFKNFRFIN